MPSNIAPQTTDSAAHSQASASPSPGQVPSPTPGQVVGPIAVYGATGHTGRFVIGELQRRSLPLVAIARDPSKLEPGIEARQASIDDAAALDRALAGCSVVINCAGPYLDTAKPVIEAALRAGCHYIDVTAEQASAQTSFDDYHAAARDAGIVVLPAAGFYGGLADLLATALLTSTPQTPAQAQAEAQAAADQQPVRHAESITTAIALSNWWPTSGTRRTGERNRVPRVVLDEGRIVPLPQPPQQSQWTFDEEFGEQTMIELPFSEIVTMARHLKLQRLSSLLNQRSLDEIRNESTPAPTAVDAQGRSAQRFVMDVVLTDAQQHTLRARATGQDIYALSGQMVVEAAARMREAGFDKRGALAMGQVFDARDFLSTLALDQLVLG